VIALLGSVVPELMAAIFGSFQFLILPRKIPAKVSGSRFSLLTPLTLNATDTTPSVVGIWVSAESPPAEVMSVAPIGTSLAPKSTVFLMNCWMPAPEPTAW